MEYKVYEMPSGIRCILKQIKSPVVYCSFTVNAGTRDELESEHGIAHLIEHLMFKGTEHRRIFHINSLLDNVGGELNAFTTKEETVVHASVLRKDFAKAVDLISDIVFHSIYPETEFAKEVSVIIDEINAYKDSPSEQIYDDFEDMVFSGSSLGRNILGTKKQLKKFRREDILRFRERNYCTDKMVFAVVGNVRYDRFVQLCDRYFGDVEAHTGCPARISPPAYQRVDKIVDKHTYQTHCMIGGRGYDYKDKKRFPLALLTNVLGGSSANSRLNTLLREKRGLTYNVEANFTTYYDAGLVSVYFGADNGNSEECLELIREELKKMRDTKMTETQLHRAKNQLIGQMIISSEATENYMLNSARSFLLYGTVQTPPELAAAVNSVTAGEILNVANEIFREDNLSTLLYK